jgi:hypothetical protein
MYKILDRFRVFKFHGFHWKLKKLHFFSHTTIKFIFFQGRGTVGTIHIRLVEYSNFVFKYLNLFELKGLKGARVLL